jgi:hypothetical protein
MRAETVSSMTALQECINKHSKCVVVFIRDIKPDGTGTKIIKGNHKNSNWSLDEAKKKLAYFNSTGDYPNNGRIMWMFDMSKTEYFCIDCDMVACGDGGRDFIDSLYDDKVIYENALVCPGTQKGYHLFYKKQECWDMSGVSTKADINKKWDLDLVTNCVLADQDAEFDGAFCEWDLSEMASIFDNGLPKSRGQQTGQVGSATCESYTRDETHDINLEELSTHMNELLGHNFGDWEVEFEADAILLTHSCRRCLCDTNHMHSDTGHSQMYLNQAEFPVATCLRHASRKIKIPRTKLLKLHEILGVESSRTKEAEARRKIREELVAEEKQRRAEERAEEKQRRAEERAAAKRQEIEREIIRLEEEGVPDEREAKRRFEERVAVIRSRACFVEEVKDDNGRVTRFFRNERQMRSLFANHRYRGESLNGKPQAKPYFERWLADEDRREYDCARIHPPGAGECPANVYNLWSPYEITYLTDYDPVPEAWDLFKDLVHILSGEDQTVADYVLKWLAYTVKFPAFKTCSSLVFLGKEGCGKGTLISYMQEICGHDKVKTTDDPNRDVWGPFNSNLEGAKIMVIEEPSRADLQDSHKLKDKITSTSLIINRKGEEPYTGTSYANYIIDTNDPDPFTKLGEDQRRFMISKTSTVRKVSPGTSENVDYWKQHRANIANPHALATIYHNLMELPDVDEFTFPSLEKPVTEYERCLHESNRPVADMFVRDFVQRHEFSNCSCVSMPRSQFYDAFREFCTKIGVEYTISQNKFTLALKNLGLAWLTVGKITRGVRHWDIDFEAGRKQYGQTE